MQKSLYYRFQIRRDNHFRDFIYSVLNGIASYPRLLLEVFIRKDFGERYFRLSSSITLIIILSGVPLLSMAFDKWSIEDDEITTGNYHDFVWYLFLTVFLIMSVKHHLDIQKNPSVFDFKKYSLSSGKIHPLFTKIKIGGAPPSIRLIETVLEPLPFLILGIVLWLLHQKLGILLAVSSVIYSLSYVADYNAGDNFVMDKIDEMICNEELKKSFIDGVDSDQTRGFSYRGTRPKDPEQRKQIFPLFEEDIADAT